MSEADSSNPQKVADLANALAAVRRRIGVGSGLYGPFYSWFRANDPDAKPWDRDSRDRLKSCEKAALEFVKEVDWANRTLSALPVSVLEPLSALIGGVPWDVRTRRTLRAIQYEASFLKGVTMAPSRLDLMLSSMGKEGFRQLQSKLLEFQPELTERLMDLDSLPVRSYKAGSEQEAPTPEKVLPHPETDGDASEPEKATQGTVSGSPNEEQNGAGATSIDHKAQTEQILNTQETDSLKPNGMTGAIPVVVEPSNSPDNKNLILQEALRAVVDGGLAGVMRIAESAPSRQKVSDTMRNMLAADPQRYCWTADDWVRELNCSKKTIIGNVQKGIAPCDAWKEIMAWRESNKQTRFPRKL